jgi:hypothetical protein
MVFLVREVMAGLFTHRIGAADIGGRRRPAAGHRRHPHGRGGVLAGEEDECRSRRDVSSSNETRGRGGATSTPGARCGARFAHCSPSSDDCDNWRSTPFETSLRHSRVRASRRFGDGPPCSRHPHKTYRVSRR